MLGLQGFKFKLLGVQRDMRGECETLNLDAFSGVGLRDYQQDFEVLTIRQSVFDCLLPTKAESYSATGAWQKPQMRRA